MSRKWRNWYENKVDSNPKGADSRDKVKHNGRSDQLFLERITDHSRRFQVRRSYGSRTVPRLMEYA